MNFGLTDINGNVFGYPRVIVYGADGKIKFIGGVTTVTATSPITSSGGLTPNISTSMNTNRLIGRSTAGVGVMEEISIGTGLSLAAGTLTNTDTGSAVTLTSAGGTETLVNDGTGPALANKGLTAGTGISLSSTATAVTITNADPASGVTLTSAGGTETLVNDGTGPSLATKGLTAGTGITLTGAATSVTIANSGVTSVGATAPITSTGGTTPTISTSMNTDRLIGRTTAGVGVMEEIQVSTGLSLSAGVLSIPYGVITPTTTNAREDNYTPTGWPGTNDVVKVIRITPNNINNIVSIGGLTNGTAGRIVHITNDATDQLLILDHQSATSTAANRFKFKHQMSYFLLPGRDITFIYDGSRWCELGQYNWAGLDLVDHMNAPQNATTDTYTNTNYFAYIRTGAGAYVRSSGSNGNYDLAGVELNTGTTATGVAYGGFSLRSLGGVNALNANGQFPFLHLTKIRSLSAPSLVQDYVTQVGLESSTANFLGYGYIWKQPTFATTYAGVWEIDVVNTAGTLAVNVVTAVSTTVDQYLGIFNHGNNGNATFFSSTDGLTYTAAYKFTRVSGTFAGWPKVRILSTVGTTAKSATFYMSGLSQNYKR